MVDDEWPDPWSDDETPTDSSDLSEAEDWQRWSRYVDRLIATANSGDDGAYRAQWRLTALMFYDAENRELLRTVLHKGTTISEEVARVRIQDLCRDDPTWRLAITYLQCAPTREQIAARTWSNDARSMIDCCQLWIGQVTPEAIRQSVYDPHLMRAELLQSPWEQWCELDLEPSYTLSSGREISLRWATRQVDHQEVLHVSARDLETGFPVRGLVAKIQSGKSDLTAHVRFDTPYLSMADALRAIQHGSPRLYPRFFEWADRHMTKYAWELIDSDWPELDPPPTTSPPKIAGIYLVQVGHVADLRERLKISSQHPDHYVVCQYGRTSDYRRRRQRCDTKWQRIQTAQTGSDVITVSKIRTIALKSIQTSRLSSQEAIAIDRYRDHPCSFAHAAYRHLVILSPEQVLQEQQWWDSR